MKELRGKAVADAHKAALAKKLEDLAAKQVVITLGILLVGDDKAAHMYAHFMEKTARTMGFAVDRRDLPATATQAEVETVIREWNAADTIYGVLPLMPMPAHIDSEYIVDLLSPDKDLDGLTTQSIGRVIRGKRGFWPCTPRACMAILDHYDIPVAGKEVVVVGRSQVVGKPVALMLLDRNATVTICHSRTADLAAKLKQADIVIAAVGKAHVIDGTMIKPGAVVIDVGINELDGHTVGDVNYASLDGIASAATPVPGGVGSVTTTILLEGLCEAYYARNVDC